MEEACYLHGLSGRLDNVAPNKDKTRAAAQKYLQKGQLDKAIREYQRLVEDDPKDVRTLLKIGDLQTRSGEHVAATETYGQVAEFYSEQGFFLKAVAVYKQILRLDTGLVDVNLRLADLYFQLGLMTDAANQYQRVIQIFEQEGRIDESIDVLKKMIELDPDHVASRIKLGESFANQGKYDQAREHFRMAMDYLKEHHRFDDYVKVAERTIHFDPSDFTTIRELAEIYVQRNDPRRALAKLQVCFKEDPEDVETLDLLALAFKALDQPAKAISVYRELGRIYGKRGDTASRCGVMQNILAIDADDVEAQQTLAAIGGLSKTASSGVQPLPQPPPLPVSSPPQANPIPSEVKDDIEVDVGPSARHPTDSSTSSPPSTAAAPVSKDPDRNYTIIDQILTESDVYVKYGLKSKAIEHIRKIFARNPTHRDARSRHKDLLLDTGAIDAALDELMVMAANAVQAGQIGDAINDVREVLRYQNDHVQAQELLTELTQNRSDEPADGDDLSLDYEPSEIAAVIDLDDDDGDEADMVLDADDVIPLDQVGITETPPELSPTDDEPIPTHAVDQETQPDETDADGRKAELDKGAETNTNEVLDVEPRRAGLDDLDALLASAVPPRKPAPIAAVPDPTLTEVDSDLSSPPGPSATAVPLDHGTDEARDDADLNEELEEIHFFLQQGLEDEAIEQLNALFDTYGRRPELVALEAKIAGAEEVDEPTIPHFETDDDDIVSVDFTTELRAELEDAVASADFEFEFQNIFEEFKRGVAEVVDDGDYQTHYDLGIAYKEMGLLSDAMREFGIAAQSSDRAVDSLTMMGVCSLALGDSEQAMKHFLHGIGRPEATANELLALRFEAGQACEILGRYHDAIEFYDQVASVDPDFRGVGQRMTASQQAMATNQGGKVTGGLGAVRLDGDSEKDPVETRGKISYL